MEGSDLEGVDVLEFYGICKDRNWEVFSKSGEIWNEISIAFLGLKVFGDVFFRCKFGSICFWKVKFCASKTVAIWWCNEYYH